MAGSVNKVILIGNLGADPEVRTFQNGGKVVNLRIATSEQWKDRNSGERRELQQENVLLKRTLGTAHTFSNIIGRSQAMRDLTTRISRVAASDTRMFIDILLTNREAVLAQLDCFAANVDALKTMLQTEDEQSLVRHLTRTQHLRAEWKKSA